MKRLGLFLAIFAIAGGSVWAGTNRTKLRALYDVVAPILAGDPATADREVGMIYYDNTAGAFKGVNKTGGIDTLTASANSYAKIAVDSPSENDLVFVSDESPVFFKNELYDTDNIYDPVTGIFTVPRDGTYTFSAYVTVGNTYTYGDTFYMSIYKNGSGMGAYSKTGSPADSVSVNFMEADITLDLPLVEGDTLQVIIGVTSTLHPMTPVYGMAGWASLKQIP